MRTVFELPASDEEEQGEDDQQSESTHSSSGNHKNLSLLCSHIRSWKRSTEKRGWCSSITQGFCRMAETIPMVKRCNLFLMFSSVLSKGITCKCVCEMRNHNPYPNQDVCRFLKGGFVTIRHLQFAKVWIWQDFGHKIVFSSLAYLNLAPNSEVLSIPLSQWSQQQCWVCEDTKLGSGGSKKKTSTPNL